MKIPNEQYRCVYNEDQLVEKVELLNALLNPYMQWQGVVARKDHEDLFGVTIKQYEVYFKRIHGQAYDDVIKISCESMDKIIYALFDGDFRLQELSKTMRKIRMKEFASQIAKLRY